VRVSVIVPAWNAARCVERSVGSALAQSRPADEVLVCDDGSTDGTAGQVEQRFGAAVTVLRLEHRNAAAARRAGSERSRGDWIAFLDADDAWHAGKLERQQAFLERHPQVRWLTADGRHVGDGTVLRESWLSDYFHPVRDLAGGKEIDKKTVHMVLDHFRDGRCIGSDQQTSGRHGLQHRPGQDEWTRQIDMNRRSLKHPAIVGIGKQARKMDPRGIDIQFFKRRLPVRFSA